MSAEYSVLVGHSECLAETVAAACAPTQYCASINGSCETRTTDRDEDDALEHITRIIHLDNLVVTNSYTSTLTFIVKANALTF